MPKTTKGGQPIKSELPSTLQRSGAKAQKAFAHAHDAAAEQYDGDERRAHQVAFAAVKRGHEKVGDHWERKDENGPSDARAEEGGRDSTAPTAEGVDANATKQHLLQVAKRLEIRGRSRMTKPELVEAIMQENRRRTRRSASR